MMKSAHPSLEVHGRKTLKKDCMLVYGDERRKFVSCFASLDSHVSFTTDMWTSVQELGYICLTAHYIDADFKLHSHPHNSTAIHSTIMECLYEWDLSHRAFALIMQQITTELWKS